MAGTRQVLVSALISLSHSSDGSRRLCARKLNIAGSRQVVCFGRIAELGNVLLSILLPVTPIGPTGLRPLDLVRSDFLMPLEYERVNQ